MKRNYIQCGIIKVQCKQTHTLTHARARIHTYTQAHATMLSVQVFALASSCGYFRNIQLPPSHKEIRNQRKWLAALSVNGPSFHPEVIPSLNHCLRSLQSSSPEKAPPTIAPSTRGLSRFQPDVNLPVLWEAAVSPIRTSTSSVLDVTLRYHRLSGWKIHLNYHPMWLL